MIVLVNLEELTVLKRHVYSADEFMNMDKDKRNDLIMEDLQVSSKLFTETN